MIKYISQKLVQYNIVIYLLVKNHSSSKTKNKTNAEKKPSLNSKILNLCALGVKPSILCYRGRTHQCY